MTDKERLINLLQKLGRGFPFAAVEIAEILMPGPKLLDIPDNAVESATIAEEPRVKRRYTKKPG